MKYNLRIDKLTCVYLHMYTYVLTCVYLHNYIMY